MKVAVIGGGRRNGKTYATIQNLTEALNTEKEKYKNLGMQYNQMVKTHNMLVDAHDALLGFFKMQCGVLYTAITGDVRVDDPIKEINPLLITDEGSKDLNYFREGMRLYISAYQETGSTVKAFEAYQQHLMGGN